MSSDFHINIDLQAIPHNEQRYNTVGDWFTVKGIAGMSINVSQMSDRRYEILVAVHELVEAELCRHAGITEEQVDSFDFQWKGIGEPGDSPDAPYHLQHLYASQIERELAKMLGVDWDAYEDELNELGR